MKNLLPPFSILVLTIQKQVNHSKEDHGETTKHYKLALGKIYNGG